MKRCTPRVAIAFLLGLSASCSSRDPASLPAPAYPPARASDHTDQYHGVAVPDPYRWLEDTASPEARAWIEAERQLTEAYLAGIPERPRLRERLTALWDHPRYGVPMARGGRYFFRQNQGLQPQSALQVLDSPAGEPRLLLDPNSLAADGTVALADFEPSGDGRLLAYGLAAAGSDWQEWRVRDVASGKDLPDVLRWVKFSGASWTGDGKGFFYSRYDEPRGSARLEDLNYHQKLFYHRWGTPQSDDALVYQNAAEKEWSFDGEVTEDGRYLVIEIRRGTGPERRIACLDLTVPEAPPADLVTRFAAAYDFITSEGPLFLFRTDLGAPRGRVVALDARAGPDAPPSAVIPEAPETLELVTAAGDFLVASYLADARSRVKVFRLDGAPVREITLPGLGTARGFEGRRAAAEVFFSFTSFTELEAVYRHDLASGETAVFRKPACDFDSGRFETRQVFAHSRDGTRVPVFVTHRKGLQLDGDQPALLFGYGGFNIPMTPVFSVPAAAWLELGGIYAVANLRGGGEYGEEWHQAGTKLRKQNVFDDFIAAAEQLIAEGYTSRERLAIWGRSNGGLLTGACLTQRPDLFRAALVDVGVLDMLRFQKFTIGWAWVSDFGSSDDPEEFRALLAYSPLHNLRRGAAYPATLISTADHDDRVVPAHSFKFAAGLQAAQAGPAPVLIRIDTRAGHGSGKPTGKLIAEAADKLAFLKRELGMVE
jgi:prolyl oligopeptidase